MKTIYRDADFKCHITNDGTMTAVDTNVFDEKCDAFIECCRLVLKGEAWTREDGEIFEGPMVSQWKDPSEVDDLQREYESELLADMQNALNVLGVTVDG
jgi:hypothetical protein